MSAVKFSRWSLAIAAGIGLLIALLIAAAFRDVPSRIIAPGPYSSTPAPSPGELV